MKQHYFYGLLSMVINKQQAIKKHRLLLFFASILLCSQVSFSQAWEVTGTAGFSAGDSFNQSLALDGSGTPYVVYRDVANSNKTTVMKFKNGSWELVGPAGFSTGDSDFQSLALDGSGTPYVAYQDVGNSSKTTVMKFNGSAWELVGVAGFSTSASYYQSLVIDGSGTPYVAYCDGATSNKTTVMKFKDGSWEFVGAAGFSAGVSYNQRLAIDGSGTPYVAYQDVGNSSKTTVMKFTGSSWELVGTAGFSAGYSSYQSLVIDGSGTPYVAYRDSGSSNKTTVMKFTGSSWDLVGAGIFSAGILYYPSLALDGSGTPYVAYRDGGNSYKTTVMKFNGTSWELVGIAGFSAGPSSYTSLAIDGSGMLYVAYRDESNSNKTTVMQFQQPLAVTGLTGVNKVYNATTAGSATGTAFLAGVKAGDDVSLSGTPVFTFASANVGTGLTITTTGYTLTGDDAGDYTLAQPSLSANITSKGLTVNVTANNKDYDGTVAATITLGTPNLTGIQGEDSVSIDGVPSAFTFASADVGTDIAVTATGNYTLTGSNSGNYTLTQPTGLTANIIAVLGLDNITLNGEVSMYPNPVIDNLNIIADGVIINTIAVHDVLGKTVLNVSITNKMIDISNLYAGIYILSINTNKGTLVKRIVKK